VWWVDLIESVTKNFGMHVSTRNFFGTLLWPICHSSRQCWLILPMETGLGLFSSGEKNAMSSRLSIWRVHIYGTLWTQGTTHATYCEEMDLWLSFEGSSGVMRKRSPLEKAGDPLSYSMFYMYHGRWGTCLLMLYSPTDTPPWDGVHRMASHDSNWTGLGKYGERIRTKAVVEEAR